MIRNYFKVTLRNIVRHKGYSFINIAGLAIGMACCLLIAIWVLDELGYDKFHANSSELYRVEENQHYSGRVYHVTVTPYPLAPALKQEIPEIIDATRVVWAGGQLFRFDEKSFFENNVRAVDPSFFDMFSYPLIRGEKTTALDNPNSICISRDIAEKYFGDQDPLGKIISVNNQYEFTVTGVLENIPHNSYLQFDILFPYQFLEKIGRTDDSFGSNSILTFVQLPKGISPDQVNEKIFGFIRAKNAGSVTDLVLMPLTRIHLHQYFGFERNPGPSLYVYIFSIIAVFVLLIACINFMNLSTARSANRGKEVGLRKVVGAGKSHLIRQFYGESVIFAAISLALALVLVILLLPAFNQLSGKQMSFQMTGIGPILMGILGITIFTGVIAGSYPALFLSSFQPVKVLRGGMKSGTSGARFRRVLVIAQFSLSIMLIIGTAVVYKQLNYMKNARLGWDKEHLVYIPFREEMRKYYEPAKLEFTKDPRILGVTGTSHLPTNIGSNSGGARWDGKDPNQTILIGMNAVDFDFIETLNIEMVSGRSFSREFPADIGANFIVNEKVAELMDKETVVGEKFSFVGLNGTIVGVMKNFHFQPVREKIDPLAIYVLPGRVQYLLVRLAPGNISGSVEYLRQAWGRVVPDYPFNYSFMDEQYDRMYRGEERIGTILRYFAGLAVFIACLGLFGLASFTAEQRTKEIGIRKVLGASAANVTVLLCREFFLLVLISNAIAWPAAYFAMQKWLQSYAYRTSVDFTLFLAAMGTALIVALISVSFQAVRAASSSPSDALKYE